MSPQTITPAESLHQKQSSVSLSTWVTKKLPQIQNFSNKSKLALVSCRTSSTIFKYDTKPGLSLKHSTRGLPIPLLIMK